MISGGEWRDRNPEFFVQNDRNPQSTNITGLEPFCTLIIDLEWNCGSDYSGFDEILQIGAVRIKALDGSILDTFNIYVRPRGNTALHPAAA